MPAPYVCYSFHDLRDPAEYGGKPPENPWVVIHCPKCRAHLTANRAQYEGASSMYHDVPYCGYHETWDLRDGTPPPLRPLGLDCVRELATAPQSVAPDSPPAASSADSAPHHPRTSPQP